MKKISTILFFAVLFTATLSAQSFKLLTKDSVYQTNHPDSSFQVQASIQNTGAAMLDITWERLDVSVPATWDVSICDPTACFPPKVITGKFSLAPNAKGNMLIDVFPNGMQGKANVRVRFSAKGIATPLLVKTAFFANAKVGTNDAAIEKAILSPNPTQDFFTIKYFDEKIVTVQVMNLTGKVIKTMPAYENATYDIGELAQGTYLVSFLNKDNQRLTAKKLVKIN